MVHAYSTQIHWPLDAAGFSIHVCAKTRYLTLNEALQELFKEASGDDLNEIDFMAVRLEAPEGSNEEKGNDTILRKNSGS